MSTLDYAALAEELLGYGNDVTVLGPPQLEAELTRLIRVVVSQHGGGAS